MDGTLVLVVGAVFVVLIATLVLLGRRHRARWSEEPPGNDPVRRGNQDLERGADARGAVNRHSWMLGGGGSGG